MAISLADNFSYSGAKPNFERDSYTTLADMVNVNENNLPAVFVGVCLETGKAYLFNKSNEIDPVLGKWREFAGNSVDSVRKTDNLETFEPMYEGEIVQFIGQTDEHYHQGYFYQLQEVIVESELTSRYVSESISNIQVDKTTFEEYTQLQEDANLRFDFALVDENRTWTLDGEPVADISVYGVTYEGEPTIGDTIFLNYTAGSSSIEWKDIDVQRNGSEEQIRDIVAEHNVSPTAHENIVSSLNDYIANVEAEKQDKLKEGENITIEEDGTINAIVDPGTRDYNELENKPAIDGVTLTSATTKEDLGLGGIFVFKGTVADLTELEAIENPSQGDTYYVTSEEGQYSWSGTEWAPIGSSVSVNIDKSLKGTGSEASPIGLSDKTQAALIVPDTTTMTPISSVEFDMNSTDYYRFLTIPNTYRTLSELNGTAIFRITITGTGINSTIEGVVYLRQRISEAPYVVMRHKSGTKSAAYTGARYMRLVYPKALKNTGDWAFDLRPYNTTARHVKVEVFKTEPNFVWNNGEIGTYTSTLQSYTSLVLYTNEGIIGSSNLYWNANTATSAGYVSSYLPKFVSGGTMPLCGEQIPAHSLTYMSSDGHVYPASNLIREIDPEFGIQLCEVTTKVNAAIAYTSLRQKEVVTSLTQIPHGTLTRGAPCYFRCIVNNGKIYSDNYVTTEITPNYTWYYIGVASSATAIMVDTTQSFFVTMNANNEMYLLNGKHFDAYTKKETDDLIELIQAGSDVRDIVKNYEELINYPVDQLKNRDVIELLEDELHEGTATYYRWIIDEENPQGHWVYLGERGPYYTKSQTRNLIRDAVAAEAAIRQDEDAKLDAKISGLAKYGVHRPHQFNIPEPENVEEGTLLFIENPALEYKGAVTSSELPESAHEGEYYLVDEVKYAVWENAQWVYYDVTPNTETLSTKYDLYINVRNVQYYGYNITSETYHPYGTSVIYAQDTKEYSPIYLMYPGVDNVQQSGAIIYSKNINRITQVASTVAPYAYKDESGVIYYWTEKIEDYETGQVELPGMRDSTHELVYNYNEEEEIYEINPIIGINRENNSVSDSEDNVYTRFTEADKLYSCFEYNGEKIWILGDANSESFSPLDKYVYILNSSNILEISEMNVEDYDATTKTVAIEEGNSYTYTDDPKVLDIFDCEGVLDRSTDIFTMEWKPLSNYGGSGKATADKVEYHNPSYPTVEAALDKLLYIAPVITKFSINAPTELEVGDTKSTTTLSWTWNKAIKTQSLNQGIGSLETNVRSYTYNTPITSNTTFRLTGSDDTTEVYKDASVTFKKYYYYGTSLSETLSDADIRALASSRTGGRAWASSNQTLSAREFNCTPTEAGTPGEDGFYAYFVVPTEYAKSSYKVTVNGQPNSGYLRTTKANYTNEYGIVIPMTIFRFMKDNKLTTTYTIGVL
jgi:hypothetical protein